MDSGNFHDVKSIKIEPSHVEGSQKIIIEYEQFGNLDGIWQSLTATTELTLFSREQSEISISIPEQSTKEEAA